MLIVLLTVGYVRRWSGINLIDAGKGDVLFSISDVWNVIARLLRLEAAIHENIGVQTEHLQEYKVTLCQEEVVLDLWHVTKTESTRGLVDHMEEHLGRGGGGDKCRKKKTEFSVWHQCKSQHRVMSRADVHLAVDFASSYHPSEVVE